MVQVQKNRVLWLSHFIPYPPKGGMLIRSYNLLLQLSKTHSVDLIALARKDTMQGMYPSFAEGVKDSESVLSDLCENVEFVETSIGESKLWTYWSAFSGYFAQPPYSVRWFRSTAYGKAVARALQSKSYDAIVVDTISLAPYVKGIADCPLILDHHNIESDMFLRRAQNEKSLIRKHYYRHEGRRLGKYEKENCGDFDLHMTCSELDSKRLASIDPGLYIREVPNGVDIEYFSPAPSSRAESSAGLIFVGGQGWYPNRDAVEFFAREIWPTLSSKNEEVTFDLVGRNPSELVRDLAQSDSRFRLHGFVDDIRTHVAAAAVYVCPIRDGGGTKLKILDALAMGKAIIAHPLAVEGIDVEDRRDVFLATSPNDFICGIEELLNNDTLRRELEINARKLAVEKYSYDSIGELFRTLMREQIARSNTQDSARVGHEN